MARIILSNIAEDLRPRVVRLLEAMVECASLPAVTKARLAGLLLMDAHELRADVREILDLQGREEVGR